MYSRTTSRVVAEVGQAVGGAGVCGVADDYVHECACLAESFAVPLAHYALGPLFVAWWVGEADVSMTTTAVAPVGRPLSPQGQAFH